MKIPKLRFKEFTEQWETKMLGEIFVRITRKNKENNTNVLTFSAHQGLINQRDYYTKNIASKDTSHYYLLHKGDFAYNKGWCEGYPIGAIKRLKYYEKGVLSTLYICFTLKNKQENSEEFFEHFFESRKIDAYLYEIVTEGARNHGLLNVGINDFFEKLKISFPSLAEQTKIGVLLSSVDDKIQALTQKKKLLEQYKKGVMQQLFSQEIRFKDENNQEFEDWTEKTLGEIGEIIGGGTPDSGNKNLWEGQIQWFTPTEIKSKFLVNSKRTINEEGLKKSSAKILPIGAILLTTRATIGDVGIATKECCTNQGFQSFVVNGKNFNEFLYYWLIFNKRMLIENASGSTFLEINKTTIKKLPISLPCLAEQTQIASFLSSLDEKIRLVGVQLTGTKDYKKGLLQEMFI